jgi:hypothetical protein
MHAPKLLCITDRIVGGSSKNHEACTLLSAVWKLHNEHTAHDAGSRLVDVGTVRALQPTEGEPRAHTDCCQPLSLGHRRPCRARIASVIGLHIAPGALRGVIAKVKDMLWLSRKAAEGGA